MKVLSRDSAAHYPASFATLDISLRRCGSAWVRRKINDRDAA